MSEYNVSYAQNREDIILSGFFPADEKGFYVDVGASHPEKLSVTKFFYDKGWHGLNIEPIPRLYKMLTEQRPRDINVHGGVSNEAGTLKLREYVDADGYSTLSPEIQKEYSEKQSAQTTKYVDQDVKVRTLGQIFREHDVSDIGFMKVDVEGFEYEVLEGNDWSKYRPKVLCIEANHIVKDWRPLLENNKYELVFFDGLNNYYVDTAKKQAKPFSYVDTILEGPLPIQASVAQQLNHLQLEVSHYREETEAQRHEIERLNFELAELRRVFPLLKRLFKSIDAAVRVRIERLNTHKTKRVSEPFVLNTEASQVELLRDVRAYDMTTYYTKSPVKQRLLYRVVARAYEVFYKMAFRLGKQVFSIARGALQR